MLSSHLSSGKTCLLLSFPVLPLSFPKNHRRRSEIAYIPSIRHSRALCVRACWDGLDPASATVTGNSKHFKVKGTVTVKVTIGGFITDHLNPSSLIDGVKDLFGNTLFLELISSELDPVTKRERERVKGYANNVGQDNGEVKYECDFTVPAKFGDIGAVVVENGHHSEMFVGDIVLDGLPNGPVSFACNSWVHPKHVNPVNRVFFSNKSYLPSETPDGLKRLRQEELEILRGNGEGERKSSDRIYDYDVYNDIGDPDNDESFRRPVLGGNHLPYPRRCRTGRPRCINDPLSEQRSSNIYVPRDEAFSEAKQSTFSLNTFRSVLHLLIPSLQSAISDTGLCFPHFNAIDSLFDVGVKLPKHKNGGFLKIVIPRMIKAIDDVQDAILQFDPPAMIDRDRFSWFRDGEFARQMLAGLNPFSIQLVSEWPLRSKLDSKIYGSPESLITKELVEEQIRGFITFEEALKQKRLFMLDYHDLFLPYVSKVRELEGTTLYASRTLMFLEDDNTLRVLAIELTRPPYGEKSQWKQVFKPSLHNTGGWLWKLAKAHVVASDAGYHQLVAHWLRTHCCTEPYIIAANRQLSAMHPIYRLLHPHFRYTMEINALAREFLINAGGIIESSFSPGKYSMELSSVAYDKFWRFDMEALPADLIRRGMAVEDPSAKHGLKLAIEDYPFANDGLILWDAIKEWVTNYVNHYYPKAAIVQSDSELQAWWTEVRTKGHADKKDEPWWPILNTQEDLIQVLTTIIWVTSGHHSAVNFGQYPFGGYFPNRPTITRRNIPTEDLKEEEFMKFLKKPEAALLETLPSQIQATKVMAILHVLSSHSPDEEYIGERAESSWSENPVINAAFEKFNARLKELEKIINERNTNLNLKNRTGAGVVPYELLKPFSDPGVTGKGVPNSISI